MRIDRYRVRTGDRKILQRHSPSDTGPFDRREQAEAHLQKGLARLYSLQEKLYAQGQWALLLIFQGTDAAGKDSVIRHVMAGVSPQGTDVHSFKQPSAEELDHDFLWRAAKVLPGRGRIGIFNRSYYEEVLVVRVHAEILKAQKLPPPLVTRRIWQERFEDISAFENHLARNGTVILKFYLHVSKREQERRLLERLDDPAKNWKFSAQDLVERAQWKAYRDAFGEALAATSHHYAPWYVIPADHKWFVRALVADIIVDALEGLNLSFPKVDPQQRRALRRARRKLLRGSTPHDQLTSERSFEPFFETLFEP
jgi:PPK2 family polyphosphate:nucleotide phosphotransferase